MSNETNPKVTYPVGYGLPPRPPTASTPLWEHLLRPKDRAPTSLTDMPIIAPPLGPLDKNATSMRVLLHDTQANFEKFAKHVGQLFNEVKEAKIEIKTTHSLFERDRECLMGDIIDLVNRSQKEIQKSIGTPPQHDFVENLFKDVNHRLSGLDQRLDALQAFNQTHTQALQTQIQAVQILLDKQGSIITAVLPLLPLLQAVPLHIDAAKTSLGETLAKHLLSHKFINSIAPVTVESLAVHSPHGRTVKRKRTDADSSLSPDSPQSSVKTPCKKARVDDISRDSASILQNASKTNSSTTAIPPEEHTAASSSSSSVLASPLSVQDSSRRNKNATKSTMTGVSPSITGVQTAPMSSGTRRGTFAVPTFVTPRRPLGDLPIPVPSSRQSSARRNPSLFNLAPREAKSERSNSFAPAFSTTGLPGLTPTAARPPRILRVHASFANKTKKTHPDVSNMVAPGTSHATAAPMQRMPTFTVSSFSEPLSNASLPGKNLELAQNPITRPETPQDSGIETSLPALSSTGFEDHSSKPQSKGVPLAVTLGKLKDRRSPVREGRRFIPLVDSDDEEGDEM